MSRSNHRFSYLSHTSRVSDISEVWLMAEFEWQWPTHIRRKKITNLIFSLDQQLSINYSG